MFARPVFKPHVDYAVVPDEGVFVLSESAHRVLRGRLYELIVPHVGGRTADEICERVGAAASPAEVYYTLSQLERRGYLAEHDESLSGRERCWWSLQQIDPAVASQRLRACAVSVQGFGVDPQPLCDLLTAAGARVAGHADLSIVVVDHYLRPELASINEASLAAGNCWLLAKPLGAQLWLGPLFDPSSTGCWKCLVERLGPNRAVESYLRERDKLSHARAIDGAGTRATDQTAWGLTANAVISWIVRGELPDFKGQVRTFDYLSWQPKSHALVKLPYCPACGARAHGPSAERQEMNGHIRDEHVNGHGRQVGDHINGGKNGLASRPFHPPVFGSGKKIFARDGGHRVVSPDVTLERYGHHVSAITGAVPQLERCAGAGEGAMHVYLAGQNPARRHHSLGQLRGDLRNMSAGKGTTDVQAKASGLCEALERHSAIFRGDEPRRTARMSELGEAAIDPRDCLLFSEKQYREREAANARPSRFNFVPLPFDAERPIEWSPVWSLTRGEIRYLPTAFCYFDYPLPKDQRFCASCSNGNAAGNTLEEAVLQGFLELVERDSVALWWYNRVRRPGVDLDSFEEPYLTDLVQQLARHEREMCVIDLTSDLQIPVFAAWSRRTSAGRKASDGAEQIVFGFGAHLDAKIALLRAVTEMNQMLSYLLVAPADKVYSDHVSDLETVHWLKTATLETEQYLAPVDGPRRRAADYRADSADDVTDDVRHCQQLVERKGLEMLVLEQTRPEIGLPVAKVIVPGLRHFWARFAPGRLYEAPVSLGWLPSALTEDQLNPIPMFL